MARFDLKYSDVRILKFCFALQRKAEYMYRARQKSNPLGKIRYLLNCRKFFLQINSTYRGGFSPYICQISLQYLIAFQKYNYLN